jgi:GNAT superfamily N-acetyltransferase
MTAEPPTPKSSIPAIRIVAAEGIDRRACRMLLPDKPGVVGWSQLLVAKDAATGAILGAAKGMPVRMESGQFQLRIAVHVPKPFRRRGVATALIDHLTGDAREQRCDSLAVLLEPEDRDGALPFLSARGFQTVDRMTTFEARVERMAALLFKQRRWLIDRGRIPAAARIVPLAEAPIEAVAELHARSIGGVAARIAASLTELARSPDGRDTVVLLIDGVVRGYHRVEFKGDLSMTHALAVTEDLRGGGAGSGWAGLFLLADRVEEGERRGTVRSRFSCLSTVRPTLRLAKIFQADIVSISEYLCRDLVR